MKNLDEKSLSFDRLICNIASLLIKRKKITLKEFGLTSTQFDLLATINKLTIDKGELIQANLAEKANIDPMTTSTILRGLQKCGLIERKRGVVNTRTIEVKLTKEGEIQYRLAQQKIDKLKDDIFQNFDTHFFENKLFDIIKRLNQIPV